MPALARLALARHRQSKLTPTASHRGVIVHDRYKGHGCPYASSAAMPLKTMEAGGNWARDMIDGARTGLSRKVLSRASAADSNTNIVGVITDSPTM